MKMIEELKGAGHYFAAGALAAELALATGQAITYGAHYGMRSTRNEAMDQFAKGYEAFLKA